MPYSHLDHNFSLWLIGYNLLSEGIFVFLTSRLYMWQNYTVLNVLQTDKNSSIESNKRKEKTILIVMYRYLSGRK